MFNGNFIKTDGINYTIEAVKIDYLAAQVYLTDLKENKVQNLNFNPVYSFTSSGGDSPARFLLSFSHVGVDNQEGAGSGISVNGNTLCIIDPGYANVEIYNLVGQKMLTGTTHGEALYRLNLSLVSGYYIVRLTSLKQVITKKVLVK